jgi:Protein of unknown function (DUF1570)
MRFRRRNLWLQLLCLVTLACGLAPLSGCNLLSIMPNRADKIDASKVDNSKVPSPMDPGSLPGKFQTRVSQYLFLADFEIPRDKPLFKELADMRDQVQKTLQLPSSINLVQVYLFEDGERYERFMKTKYPDLPKRRAFFIAQPRPMGGEELLVYTYWGNGDRIQQDLRHELTHALLHSVLKDVPLWLDEGLAEYFEIPKTKTAVNLEHMKQLRHGPSGPVQGDLNRLEQMTQVDQMSPAEYREAWAWVHLMLHSNDDARKVLVSYLKELRSTKNPGPLRPRLTTVFPSPETALTRHLMLLDANTQPVVAGN